MKENPYARGEWEMLPIPESGNVFAIGDRVVTRGQKRLHGSVIAVTPQYVKKDQGIWVPWGQIGADCIVELVHVKLDRDERESDRIRGQDLDFEDAA